MTKINISINYRENIEEYPIHISVRIVHLVNVYFKKKCQELHGGKKIFLWKIKLPYETIYFLSDIWAIFSGYPTDTISVTSALNETSGLNGLIRYVAIFGNDTTR